MAGRYQLRGGFALAFTQARRARLSMVPRTRLARRKPKEDDQGECLHPDSYSRLGHQHVLVGPITVIIAAGVPHPRRLMSTTSAKALLDLLIAHQVIEYDAEVVSITLRWDSAVPAGIVRVTVCRA